MANSDFRCARARAAAVVAAVVYATAASAGAGSSPRDTLSASINRFAAETLGQLAGPGADTNVVISPFGLGSALHILAAGAEGATERRLRSALGVRDMSAAEYANGLRELRSALAAASGEQLTLRSVNGIWIAKPGVASRTFRTASRELFGAPVRVVDFRDASVVAAVNDWAKSETLGLIPTVVDRIDERARFLIANATHFKGAWQTAFDPALTRPATFTRVSGVGREVPMMEGTIPVRYAETGSLHAVWLPYHGERLQMLVVAPREGTPADAVGRTLRKTSLAELARSLDPAPEPKLVHVRLPRFKAEFSEDLARALGGQHLGAVLGSQANYGGMGVKRSGQLLVLHRALVEVTEAGTEAAAATVVTENRSLAGSLPVFSVDRPFAFAIIDRETKAMLFAGYIADPVAAGPLTQ